MFTKEDKNQKWYKETYLDAVKGWFMTFAVLAVTACLIFEYVDTVDTEGYEVNHHGEVVTISRDF